VTFKEKVSGAKTDRPELAKVIRRLEPGDVLVVTRLDRLARSTRDLLNILGAIAERGAGLPKSTGAGNPATTFAQWWGFPWTLSFTAEPTAAGEVVSAAFSLKQGGLPCNKGCIGWITIR
jgi:hypothetical protein